MGEHTETDYFIEKENMNLMEKKQQERFEGIINVLILYKQQNPMKEVYLSEKSIKEAIKWYQERIMDNI